MKPALPSPPKRPRTVALPGALALALCLAAPLAQPAAAQGYTSGYVQVAVGASHSCALRHDGQVWCWGANNFGQLGIGSNIGSPVPVQARSPAAGFGSNNIASIGALYFGNCALNTAGRAFCWGGNSYGELGDGTITTRLNPARVRGLGAGMQTLATGTYSTCAIDAGGRAWCWGRNSEGQVGDGTTGQATAPVAVDTSAAGFGQGNIATIATGGSHACAINAAGRAFCWGNNLYGQLGINFGGNRFTPASVSVVTPGFGTRNIAQIAVGVEHSCARNVAGRLFCWGRDTDGQTGTGSVPFGSLGVPTHTDTSASGFGVRNIAHVVTGAFGACALNTPGRAYCWGRNGSGQVGDGTTLNRNAPVQVARLGTGLRDISTKLNHSCAIDADGDVWCWGSNAAGQLGDGTTTNSLVPVKVVGLP